MSRLLAFWGCEPGAGRRTVARKLVGHWTDQGKSALLLTIDPEEVPSVPDPAAWVPRFQSLSPVMLRQYLSGNAGSHAVLSLNQWPLPDLLQSLMVLLKRSFDWIAACGPQERSSNETALLDASDLLVAVARPGADSASGLRRLMDQLSRDHYPHAFCQVIVNRVPGPRSSDVLSEALPGKCALAWIEEDPGSGLRLREGLKKLALLLEERPDIYVQRQKQIPSASTEAIVEELKNRVQPKLLSAFGADEPVSQSAQKTAEACLAEDATLAATREERGALLSRVLDDVLGLGPLEPLLKDPAISEIMVNGRQRLYVERKGKLYASEVPFTSDAQLRAIIDRIVSPVGRRVDESMPLCDARLADGSRVNIVLPPLALDGPAITIRKFMPRALGFEDLAELGSMSRAMADFLRRCVIGRKNMVVSGGTGSGKTTLLNALSSVIPEDERIVTIEDAAELRLQKPHVVRLESRPPNAEGEGAIPIRRLVINALRMRPDRIVIGECRGGEALDMLQAMNTGHDGSLTTVHANSPRDALGRLETLVLMAGMELPARAIREQIRSAVQVIVQQARLADGSRKVVSITELTGMEGDLLTTQELFRYQEGRFESTEVLSRLLPGGPL